MDPEDLIFTDLICTSLCHSSIQQCSATLEAAVSRISGTVHLERREMTTASLLNCTLLNSAKNGSLHASHNMQCSAVKCIAVYSSAVQCNALQCTAQYCSQ